MQTVEEIRAEFTLQFSKQLQALKEWQAALSGVLLREGYVISSCPGLYLQRDQFGALHPGALHRASWFTEERAEEILAGIPGDFWGDSPRAVLHITDAVKLEIERLTKQIESLKA